VPDEDVLAVGPTTTIVANSQALYDGSSPGLMETSVGEVPSRAVVASLPTYRESHGLDNTPASVTSFLPGLSGLVVYA
jgi:hypothetical protein